MKAYNRFSGEQDQWIFRGQSNAEYGLKTRLERAIEEFDLDINKMLDLEGGLLRRFKRQSRNYLTEVPDEANYMEWFALMQHYGAPTRLLDWTYSFFVAVYFAVECAEGECAVWAFNSDSPTKKIKEIYPDYDFKALDDDPNTIVRENFEQMFVNNMKLVCPMNPRNLNERLVIQQGVFLCPGDVSVPFEENLQVLYQQSDLQKNLVKYAVKNCKKLRSEILLNLHRMNMNRATLFPGLDGFAESLRTLLVFPQMLVPDSDYVKEKTW